MRLRIDDPDDGAVGWGFVAFERERGLLSAAPEDEFAFPGNNIFAVYPERRLLPAKVKFFIEFLRKTFGDPPYWE